VTGRAHDASAIAETCLACHGELGVSLNPLVPTLAGQPFTLIEDNLLAFRAGKRSCAAERADGSASASLAQTMCAIVEPLENSEIAALAEYFSHQDFVAAKQPFDPQLAALGAELHDRLGCNRCHANGGRETLEMAPVLAGQWTPYLRRALNAVHTGQRRGPKMMNQPIVRLEEEQIEALLNFYASQYGATP
jgi:sulfide dehydrogenase cytochrome subunit